MPFDDAEKEKLSNEIKTYLSDLNSEFDGGSDRGAVLVMTTGLDYMVQKILATFFLENEKLSKSIFEGTGPLASFSARIKLCAALGLISEQEATYLDKIRAIRNEFAHQFGIKLDDTSIADRCSYLYGELPEADPSATTPRAKIGAAGASLFVRLAQRYIQAKAERRSPPGLNIPNWVELTKSDPS